MERALETIAVYWEPIIRVYGFEVIPDTSLIQVNLPVEQADYWGKQVEALQKTGTTFIMAVLQMIDTTTVSICLLLRSDSADECLARIENADTDQNKTSIKFERSVDVIFFHGPHFQDRYGIADAAFRVLGKHNISLLAAGCTGTSIYLVTTAGAGATARNLLAEAFVVP